MERGRRGTIGTVGVGTNHQICPNGHPVVGRNPCGFDNFLEIFLDTIAHFYKIKFVAGGLWQRGIRALNLMKGAILPDLLRLPGEGYYSES